MENQGRRFKKFWKPPSFEDFNITSPSKKIKLDSIPDDCLDEKMNFIPNEATEPKTISELAIHSKKIEEVRNWMKLSHSQKAPILLVTGPTGSGKTTTVKTSADAEGFIIKEWINPVDKTDYKVEPIMQTDCYEKFTFSETGQSDKFEDFVFRSSRYTSIFEKSSGTLIIVEDLPNIFVWKPKLFHSFLEKYKSRGKSPIVFIVTDDQNLNLSSNLFPNNIKLKFSITNIKFNPVNQSCLVKNLKALSEFYCPEKVSSQILENISKNSNGDIRTATNDFLLFLRTNSEGLNQLARNCKKKVKHKGSGGGGGGGACEVMSLRDSSFDFYHILGRILYPKLMSEKEKLSCDNTNRIFLHDVQEIADNLSNSFLGVLHENYLQTLGKFKDVVEGAQCFSFCDVLGRHQELEPYTNLVGAIGLMSINREPRKSGFHPIKKGVGLNLNKISSSAGGEVQVFQDRTSRKDVLLDLIPFVKTLQIDERYRNVFSESKSGVEPSEKVYCDDESDDEPIEIEEFED